jgi:hypothetical protein
MGTPLSSYSVIDDTDKKTFISSPTKARTAEELIREGYSPSIMHVGKVLNDTTVYQTEVVGYPVITRPTIATTQYPNNHTYVDSSL